MSVKDETPPEGVECTKYSKAEETKESHPPFEKSEAEEEHNITFEDLLELAGTNGIWNYMLFVIIYIGGLPSAFAIVSYQFVGATPAYWCHIQELQEANWTDHQVIDFAIPRKEDGKLEGCLQRDYNYSLAASLGYEAAKDNLDLVTNVVNGTMSCLSRDFNLTQYASTLVTQFDLVCERRALYSTTSSIAQMGMLFASLIVGHVTDLFGKRRLVLVCYLFVILFGAITPLSPTVEMFIMCKFLVAFFDMTAFVTKFVLSLELSGKSERSYVGTLSGIPWAIGQMLLPGVAYLVREWKYLQLALTVPYLYSICYYWLLPESPRWLILQGRYEEAIKWLKTIARWNKRSLPSDEKLMKMLEHINIKAGNLDKEDEAKPGLLQRGIDQVKDLFQTQQKAIQTLVLFCCWFVTAFVYYGVSLSGTNIGSNEYWYMFFGGLVEIPAYFILWPLIFYLGRRIMLIASFFITAISLFGSLGVRDFPVWATTLSMAGKFAITSSFTLVYLLAAELNTTKSRTLAVGISSVIARFGSVSSPYVNDLIGAKNPAAPAIMFGVTASATGLLSFFLPETRKAILPESRTDIENLGTERTAADEKAQHHEASDPPRT